MTEMGWEADSLVRGTAMQIAVKSGTDTLILVVFVGEVVCPLEG